MRELLIVVVLVVIMTSIDRKPDDAFEKTCLDGVSYWFNPGNGYGPALAPAIDSVTLQPTRC